MPNQLSKTNIELLHKVIVYRDFAALADLENIYKIFLENRSDCEDRIPSVECILLYYIYYIMLKKDERGIFPIIRKIIVESNTDLVHNHKEAAMLALYNNIKWEDGDPEEKLLFLISAKILKKYDSESGFDNELNQNINFNIVVKSIYENEYSKFTDYNLLILLLGYDLFNVKELFEPNICEKIDVILYNLIQSIFNIHLFGSGETDDECPTDIRIENNFNEMRFI